MSASQLGRSYYNVPPMGPGSGAGGGGRSVVPLPKGGVIPPPSSGATDEEDEDYMNQEPEGMFHTYSNHKELLEQVRAKEISLSSSTSSSSSLLRLSFSPISLVPLPSSSQLFPSLSHCLYTHHIFFLSLPPNSCKQGTTLSQNPPSRAQRQWQSHQEQRTSSQPSSRTLWLSMYMYTCTCTVHYFVLIYVHYV